MEPLQTAVDNYQDRRREVLETLDADEQDARDRLEAARTAIIQGDDTTGDTMQDGLIVIYGKDLLESPQIVERYERVADELRGKRGQPVVAISRWDELTGCTGFGGRGQKTTNKLFSVGKLSATKLIFDYEELSASLPTSKYVESRDEYRSSTPQITKGPLQVASPRSYFGRHMDLGRQLDVEVRLSDPFESIEPSTALTLAIGHTGIEKWLAEDRYPTAREYLIVRKLAKRIGLPAIEPVTERQKAHVEQSAKV